MRVDDQARKSVVFVGARHGDRFTPLGTGFLASVRYQTVPLIPLIFVVTADHVVEQIAGDNIAVRLNRKSGDVFTVTLEKKNKLTALDKDADLAIFFLPTPIPDDCDHTSVLLDRSEFKAILDEIWAPGLGDEIVTAGLYTSHHGVTKNVPVVRIGHIAMLPDKDDPVLTQRGCFLPAYLVEVKSIAGLSGSPVSINLPLMRLVGGKPEFRDGSSLICIGMMLGYHLVASAEDQIVVPKMQGEEPQSEYSLDERNTGFAVVVPIEKLFDVMEASDTRKIMDAEIRRRRQSDGA